MVVKDDGNSDQAVAEDDGHRKLAVVVVKDNGHGKLACVVASFLRLTVHALEILRPSDEAALAPMSACGERLPRALEPQRLLR